MNEVLSEFNDISIYKKLYNFQEFSKSIGVQRKLPYVQVFEENANYLNDVCEHFSKKVILLENIIDKDLSKVSNTLNYLIYLSYTTGYKFSKHG